ncbi:hypothetical protein GQ600_5906 [Phytophthora cactorum]|nr:hypothetical protein GQ600_5906 [Phytophthora cactorum]
MEIQRDASQTLRQSMKNLHQMSASAIELFTEMEQPIRRSSWSFNSALDDCSAELKPSSQTVLFVILAVEAFYVRIPLCFS